LTSPQRLLDYMDRLRAVNTPTGAVYFNHFTEKFLALAQEELSGVKSTILNILFFYQHPDIVAVFGQPHSTVDFSLTDHGKIFCCSIPQRFDAERGFLNTLMKIAWYAHIKSRFNLSDDVLARRNLNVLWADEAQRVVTKSELGMADHNQVDQIREAKGCAIFSTQTERSFVPPLGRDIKNTLVDNLGNEIAFCQTNQEDAEILAKRIGERTLEKTSRSISRQSNGFSTSRSYQEKEEPFFKPHVLRNLKKHSRDSECVIRHCEKGYQRTALPFTSFTQKMTGPATAAQVTADGQPYDSTVAAKLQAAGSRITTCKIDSAKRSGARTMSSPPWLSASSSGKPASPLPAGPRARSSLSAQPASARPSWPASSLATSIGTRNLYASTWRNLPPTMRSRISSATSRGV
jgi:hypothetical protein